MIMTVGELSGIDVGQKAGKRKRLQDLLIDRADAPRVARHQVLGVSFIPSARMVGSSGSTRPSATRNTPGSWFVVGCASDPANHDDPG
jgi:hypothetical protein